MVVMTPEATPAQIEAVVERLQAGGVHAKVMPGELRHALHDLRHVPGADRGWRDRLPTLYSFLAFAHHERLSRREHEQLFVAMSDDVCWNGEPIPGMSDADAKVLAELERVRA